MTISIQQPQLQVHFEETQGHTWQQKTVIQIHQLQDSGHVISVENGSFRLQVENTSSYGASHTGYTQHTNSVSMATGSSVQETHYTQGSSELVTTAHMVRT